MKTIVYEKSLRAQICEKILASSAMVSGFECIIILPIPSTRDGVYINGMEIMLSDALAKVSERTLVVGYGIPDKYKDAATMLGATVWDGALDERFLIENAELTALGTLGILLGDGRRAPSDTSYGIVGYGRIGARLLRLLLFLGARVRVYTSRPEVRLELAESGVETCDSYDAAPISGIDVLINTAPARIFSFTRTDAANVRIIDLASGVNFPDFITAERYPSLPARAFPETAGRVWAESVERYLFSGEEGEG